VLQLWHVKRKGKLFFLRGAWDGFAHQKRKGISVLHVVLLIAVPTVKHSMMFRKRETVCYISCGYKLHTHTRAHAHTCAHEHTWTHTRTHARTHTHAHTHEHTHAHTHAHINTHAHTHTHEHTRAHTCTQTHTLAHTHAHINTHMHTQTCTHTHAHTHEHTCTHTCTQTCTQTCTHTCTYTHIYTYFSKGLDLGNFLHASSQVFLCRHGGTTRDVIYNRRYIQFCKLFTNYADSLYRASICLLDTRALE
jgi:hypothetical protein